MSLRLLEQEKEAALKPSPSLKVYPITTYAGSAKVEGQPATPRRICTQLLRECRALSAVLNAPSHRDEGAGP